MIPLLNLGLQNEVLGFVCVQWRDNFVD